MDVASTVNIFSFSLHTEAYVTGRVLAMETLKGTKGRL